MRRITVLPLLLLLCSALQLRAAEVPIPPAPSRWVTDTAGFISPGLRTSLDQRLGDYARTNGTQVLVWIGTTTGDTPTEDWTVRAFARWKVGQKGLDNGLVVFIFAQDHKVRIEVGYGLEDRVPDVVASRIIRNIMAPRIQAGDHDGAVTAGVDALLSAIGGNASAGGQNQPQSRAGRAAGAGKIGFGQIVLFVILGIGFLFLLITNPTLALYLLFSILSGGRGGGGFGGGGFSGGGGRSGGGGATGSW